MSANDHRGAYWAIRSLMASVDQDIQAQRRQGADRRYPERDRSKTDLPPKIHARVLAWLREAS